MDKKRKASFKITDAGAYARDIFNELIAGINMEATTSSITIEVDLLIKDNNVFKDDEKRNAKIVINVDLIKKEGPSIPKARKCLYCGEKLARDGNKWVCPLCLKIGE